MTPRIIKRRGAYDTPAEYLIMRLLDRFGREYFTLEQAAEALDVHPGDLYAWLWHKPAVNGNRVCADSDEKFYSVASIDKAKDCLPPLTRYPWERGGVVYFGY